MDRNQVGRRGAVWVNMQIQCILISYTTNIPFEAYHIQIQCILISYTTNIPFEASITLSLKHFEIVGEDVHCACQSFCLYWHLNSKMCLNQITYMYVKYHLWLCLLLHCSFIPLLYNVWEHIACSDLIHFNKPGLFFCFQLSLVPWSTLSFTSLCTHTMGFLH